jgi:hypothetical protein
MHFWRHPWPFASAISLVGMHARVNCLFGADLKRAWGPFRVPSGHFDNRTTWHDFYTTTDPAKICRDLNLNAAEWYWACGLHAWWPQALKAALEEREPTWLRYCATCALAGYHSPLFQLPWWTHCPLHDEALRASCPHCGAPMRASFSVQDPARALSCENCQHDLVDIGQVINTKHWPCRDFWTYAVAQHRRWIRDIDHQFIVPLMGRPLANQFSAQQLVRLIAQTHVSPPASWRTCVSLATNFRAPPTGYWAHFQGLRSHHRQEGLHLAAAAQRWIGDENMCLGDITFALTTATHRLLKHVARRCENQAGAHRVQTWRREFDIPNLLDDDAKLCLALRWPHGVSSDFRRRGFARRDRYLRYGHNLRGRLRLVARDSEVTRLDATRLAALFHGALRARPKLIVTGPIRMMSSWAYRHLLANIWVDATVQATHSVSYIDMTQPDPLLNEKWPAIHLDRIPPARSWWFAALQKPGSHSEVLAFLMPVRLDTTTSPCMDLADTMAVWDDKLGPGKASDGYVGPAFLRNFAVNPTTR